MGHRLNDEEIALQAKNLRYKRAALEMLQRSSIIDMLDGIAEECSGLEWAIMDDDGFLDALGGDSGDRSEFSFAFSDLSGKCELLQEAIYDTHVTEHFDDFFVGIMGNRYQAVGYDSFEEDYYGLTMVESGLAQRESGKRLSRLTKDKILSVAGQCIGVAFSVLDIRHQFDALKAAIHLLKGERLQLLREVGKVEETYEKAAAEGFCGEHTQTLDKILWRLPDKVWVG